MIGLATNLEPDGEIVDEDEEGRAQCCNEPTGGSNSSLSKEAWWYSSMILLPVLDCAESDQENGEHDEKCNHTAIAPGILASSPLQRKQEADNHGQKEQGAEDVELVQLLLPPNGQSLCILGWVVEDDDEQEGNGSDR